jgi:hypothetical protein
VQACVFRAKQPLGPVRDNGGGTVINWKSSAALPQADLHAFPGPGQQRRAAHPRALRSLGRGVLDRLRPDALEKRRFHEACSSAAPGGAVEIQPNFLAEAGDLDALVIAVETMMELAATESYADLVR